MVGFGGGFALAEISFWKMYRISLIPRKIYKFREKGNEFKEWDVKIIETYSDSLNRAEQNKAV